MGLVERIFDMVGLVIVIVVGSGVMFVVTIAIIYGIKRVLRRLRIPPRLRQYVGRLTSNSNFVLSSNTDRVEDALTGLLLDATVNNRPFRVARNMVIDCLVMTDCWGREVHKGYVNLYTTNHSAQPISFAQKVISLDKFWEGSGEELGTLIQLTRALFGHVVLKQGGLFLAEEVDEKIETWLQGWSEWCDFWSPKKPPPLPLFGNEIFDYYGDKGKDLANLFDCWHRFYSNLGLLNRKGRKGLQEFIEKLGRRNFRAQIIKLISMNPSNGTQIEQKND